VLSRRTTSFSSSKLAKEKRDDVQTGGDRENTFYLSRDSFHFPASLLSKSVAFPWVAKCLWKKTCSTERNGAHNGGKTGANFQFRSLCVSWRASLCLVCQAAIKYRVKIYQRNEVAAAERGSCVLNCVVV
jgi:hypothetical protein